jgi:hypothetical protein
LSDFLEMQDDDGEVCLIGSKVGFAKQALERAALGLRRSKELSMHHSCVVFGDDGVNDVTATVDLNLSKTTCHVYDGSDHSDPDLRARHGALGEAVMHAMNVWRCLARIGERARCLSAVVLAASKTGHEHNDRLCCMDARVYIPKQFGGDFGFGLVDAFSSLQKTISQVLCLRSRKLLRFTSKRCATAWNTLTA